MSYYGDQQGGNGGFFGSTAGGSSADGGSFFGSQPQQPGTGFFGGGGENNMQQWQQPQGDYQPQSLQQQQQQQYNHQQQQQSQQQAPQNLFNPAMAANMVGAAVSGGMNNDAMMNLATSAGKDFIKSGTAKMVPGLESAMLNLRAYFAVDNKYVLAKSLKILFPFTSKHWKRQQKSSPQPGYALPNVDQNAPDLYLPSMSLITYVLLCALCYGTAKHFDPEVIPDVTTKCFVTQILEVLAIRFGFHLMQAQVPMLDLFSYTGYKYLGLSINMFVGLLLGHLGYGHHAYYITFLWTASAISYFMLKTMANNIPVVTASTGPKREVMVVAFAVSQFVTMWFVSQTKFL